MVPAFGLIALHDKRVTGSWSTLPYALCRYEYGVPCTFMFQANPVPHRQLTREQKIGYDVQSFVHGENTDTIATFLKRLAGRVRFYRFFFLPPLYLALPAFFWSFRDPRMRYVFFVLLMFCIGTNVYPYFYAHYVAGVTCLFLLVTVASLENLRRLTIAHHLVGPDAVRVILLLCGAHFVFWYGVQLSSNQQFAKDLEQYESWDEVNHGDLDGRIGVNNQLAQAPGKQLVFVRYWPKHAITEWVYNGADIDRQAVVFARDLGAIENQKLKTTIQIETHGCWSRMPARPSCRDINPVEPERPTAVPETKPDSQETSDSEIRGRQIVGLLGTFDPVKNPIGFGAGDFIEFTVAFFLVALVLAWRPLIEPYGRRFSLKTRWCMLALAAAPVALRLALLAHHPIPTPDIYDEFGHLFVADTLLHFRLANPAHAMHRFFETFFILQEPTYSSIYPIGQGVMLAIGRVLSGFPWTGVLLATSAFAALCYWMLRGWTTPAWALAGGVLAVIEFGPLNQWMNSYWGGALAAAAGCLVFGALPRLAERARTRDAIILGAGLTIHLLTRPYESIFLGIAVLLFFVPALKQGLRAAPIVILAVIPAIGIMLLHDKSVTGHWTMLPYQLSQYEYGVPASLTFQPNPIPHRELTPQQQLEYKSQIAFRGTDRETIQSYLLRLEYRVRFYRFFFLAPLFLAIPAFCFAAAREFRYAWVLIAPLLFALGINFFPSFQLHYLGAATCLFVLISVAGLREISRWSPEAARLVLFLCAIQFVFWYGMHVFEGHDFARSMMRYEIWDSINHANPERRILVNQQLAQITGRVLVFVRYSPFHIFQDEWVYNEANIDSARVIWARDLGKEENDKLRALYPQREVLLLEPDAKPLRLSHYEP